MSLSSTYLDLIFERRHVARWLMARGWLVVTVERDGRPDFHWQRWCTNRAS